jgi:SH3 domain protein
MALLKAKALKCCMVCGKNFMNHDKKHPSGNGAEDICSECASILNVPVSNEGDESDVSESFDDENPAMAFVTTSPPSVQDSTIEIGKAIASGVLSGMKDDSDGVKDAIKAHQAEIINNESMEYSVTITALALNVRSGPGLDYRIVRTLVNDKNTYTIVEEVKTGGGIPWGKLKSGLGWINLEFTKKM